MIIRPLLALLILHVAACAERPLPVATGPIRQLNVGKWVPGPGDLDLPAAAEPGRSG